MNDEFKKTQDWKRSLGIGRKSSGYDYGLDDYGLDDNGFGWEVEYEPEPEPEVEEVKDTVEESVDVSPALAEIFNEE